MMKLEELLLLRNESLTCVRHHLYDLFRQVKEFQESRVCTESLCVRSLVLVCTDYPEIYFMTFLTSGG